MEAAARNPLVSEALGVYGFTEAEPNGPWNVIAIPPGGRPQQFHVHSFAMIGPAIADFEAQIRAALGRPN
jgi:hypothetical protein